MPGTNIWGAVFCIGAIVVAVLVVSPLINMWRRYFADVVTAIQKKVKEPSWVGPTITTVLCIGVYAVVATLGWNAMVNATATSSDYKPPAEVQEQKRIQDSQLPASPALDASRADQKARQQDKPYKEALTSYDEAMAKEAEKIKQRTRTRMRRRPRARRSKHNPFHIFQVRF